MPQSHDHLSINARIAAGALAGAGAVIAAIWWSTEMPLTAPMYLALPIGAGVPVVSIFLLLAAVTGHRAFWLQDEG